MSQQDSIDSTLRTAIRNRRVVTFTLDGCDRVGEPHDYGVITGEKKLLFYQLDGGSRSGRPLGWKWAKLDKIVDLTMLDQRFAGPRPAPSGRHAQWDHIFASVSRPAS